MEGIQISRRRSEDQENVRQLSDLWMSDQVRRLFLGWLLGAVYLACAPEEWLGVLCHLCRAAFVRSSVGGGSSCSTTWKQVDDDHIHVWMHRCNGLLYLQGWNQSRSECRTYSHYFLQLIKVLIYNQDVQFKLVWKTLTVFCKFLPM